VHSPHFTVDIFNSGVKRGLNFCHISQFEPKGTIYASATFGSHSARGGDHLSAIECGSGQTFPTVLLPGPSIDVLSRPGSQHLSGLSARADLLPAARGPLSADRCADANRCADAIRSDNPVF
jgi:hypothetical protein